MYRNTTTEIVDQLCKEAAFHANQYEEKLTAANLIEKTAGPTVDALKNMASSAGDMAGRAWGATKDMAGRAWDATRDAAGRAWDATKYYGNRGLEAGSAGLNTAMDEARRSWNGAPTAIEEALANQHANESILSLMKERPLNWIKNNPYAAAGIGAAGLGAAALPFLMGGEKEGSYIDPNLRTAIYRDILRTEKTAGSVTDTLKGMASSAGDMAGRAWGATKDMAGRAWDATRDAAGRAWDATKYYSGKTLDAADAAIAPGIDDAIRNAKGMPSRMEEALANQHANESILGLMQERAKPYYDDAVAALNGYAAKAKAYGNQALDTMKNYGGQAVDAVKNYGGRAADAIENYGGRAMTALKGLPDQIENIGGSAMAYAKSHPYTMGVGGAGLAAAAALPYLMGGEKEGSYHGEIDPQVKIAMYRDILNNM